MSKVRPRWTGRRLPKFFLVWRSQWNSTSDGKLSPLNYIDFQNGLPFLICGAWIFCPETIEYRGCLFIASRFFPDNVDTWFEQFNGSIKDVQAMGNQTKLYDYFGNNNIDEYDKELDQLAMAIGECWQGILSTRYPDRVITVVVSDDDDGSYGPTVTFWSEER